MFYVGCHRPTTTLLLYPDLGQAVNGALAEFFMINLLDKNHGSGEVLIMGPQNPYRHPTPLMSSDCLSETPLLCICRTALLAVSLGPLLLLHLSGSVHLNSVSLS